MPVIAVSGGAVGVVVGVFTLAAVKPSFQQFLEKRFPAVKPVMSSLGLAKEMTTNNGSADSANSMETTQETVSDKVPGREVCIVRM